jgi:hypothetical protein
MGRITLAAPRALAGEAGGASRLSSASPIGMDAMISLRGLKLKERNGSPP